MNMFFTARLILSGAACSLGACESQPKVTPTKIDVPPLKCDIDISNPGPLRRGGLARIELNGKGVSINKSKVNAWCGPLFNTDVEDLGVRAGQGLLFETCMPEGTLQLTAYDRPNSGKQDLHSARQSGGVELLFNQNGGPSYTSRGGKDDSIVLSADLWRADANVVLQDVATGARITATVTFDCANSKTGAPLPSRAMPDVNAAPTASEAKSPAVSSDKNGKRNEGAAK